ncbi:hypothetical protein SprV_0602125800 [Sparganum proliferum]
MLPKGNSFESRHPEARSPEQDQLKEVCTGYTFFWSGLSKAERRDSDVTFVVRNDVVERMPFLSQDVNDRLMNLRLPLWEPNSTPSDEAKNNFFKDLHTLQATESKADKMIGLSNFTAGVGTYHTAWECWVLMVPAAVRVTAFSSCEPAQNSVSCKPMHSSAFRCGKRQPGCTNDRGVGSCCTAFSSGDERWLQEMQDARMNLEVEKIQGYADRNEATDSITSIRVACSPPAKGTGPLCSSDEPTLLTGKSLILQRWVKHFKKVLNHPPPYTISDVAINWLPQVGTNADPEMARENTWNGSP